MMQNVYPIQADSNFMYELARWHDYFTVQRNLTTQIMKKTLQLIAITLIVLGGTPTPSKASEKLPSPTTHPMESQIQIDRLNEIKSMDLKTLNRKQRKELRHEVKSIQKAQSSGNGGIYLSVGAIIIIILLLILIL
jgi:hypothetical protein